MSYLLNNMADAIDRGDHEGTMFGNLLSWTTKLEEEGVTLLKSPAVGFSMTPTYTYMILETRETFYSSHADGEQAYRSWKERKVSGYPENAEWPPRKFNLGKCATKD